MLFCPHCRGSIDDVPEYGGQVVACPHCAGRFTMPHVAPPVIGTPLRFRRQPRDKAAGMLAAILSFLLPGLGQFCQGRIGPGFAFMLACFVSGVATVLFVLPVLIFVPLWIWSVADAAWH